MTNKISLIIGIIILLLGIMGLFILPVIIGDSRAIWILFMIIGIGIILMSRKNQSNNKFKNKKGVKK